MTRIAGQTTAARRNAFHPELRPLLEKAVASGELVFDAGLVS
jgi:hypothetical protein